jgi:translation initiation factor 2A
VGFPRNVHFQVEMIKFSVNVVDATTGTLRHVLTVPNVVEIAFSPLGSYLNTWERPWKNEEDGQAGKNLKIWNMETGQVEQEFVQKSQNGWNLQYSQDEKICCRNVTNEVHIYETKNLQAGIPFLEKY